MRRTRRHRFAAVVAALAATLALPGAAFAIQPSPVSPEAAAEQAATTPRSTAPRPPEPAAATTWTAPRSTASPAVPAAAQTGTMPPSTAPRPAAATDGPAPVTLVLTGLALVALVAGSGYVVRRAAIQVPLLIPAPR